MIANTVNKNVQKGNQKKQRCFSNKVLETVVKKRQKVQEKLKERNNTPKTKQDTTDLLQKSDTLQDPAKERIGKTHAKAKT